MAEVTFVTPTYAGDLSRFAFLRESMDLVGISIPHIAVVHTEDVPSFAAIAKTENLTIVSTAEVLPGPAEVLRRGPARRRIRRRGRELPGWVAQQIVKLAVSDLVESQVIVPLDSDAFFLRKVDPSDFFADDGRSFLHEFRGLNVGSGAKTMHERACRILDLDPASSRDLTYVGVAPPLNRDIIKGLRTWLEQKYERPWWEAFITRDATEYPLHGLYARFLDSASTVTPIDRRWCAAFYGYDEQEFTDQLSRAALDPSVRLGLVDSKLGVEPEAYHQVVRRAIATDADSESSWKPRGATITRI